MHVKKNDMVLVIAGKGRTQKNNTGKVLKVFPDQERIVVEGINLIHRHTKPSQRNRKGGIIEKEGTVHVSDVMLYCNKCNSATRIAHRFLEDGTKVRICKKCGEII